MMEFPVRYRGALAADTHRSPARVAVTDAAVCLTCRQSPLSAHLYAWGLLLITTFAFVIVPLAFFFGWAGGRAPIPGWVGLIYPWLLLGSVLALAVACLPLRRRRVILPRAEITGCAAHAREVLLQTADAQLVVTARATADARTLAAAVTEGAACDLPVQWGRESLLDTSGFNHLAPVTLNVDGALTLTGRAQPNPAHALIAVVFLFAWLFVPMPILSAFRSPLPAWAIWVFLAGCLGGMMGIGLLCAKTKPLTRIFALSDLRELAALHHFVTFLIPDEKLGERRCTFVLPTPDDAATLACRLRGESEEPFFAMAKLAANSKNNADIRYWLHPATADGPARPGRVYLDKARVTFTGRAGLAHPWSWRLAAALALLASFAFAPVLGRLAAPLQLGGRELVIITWVPACMLALLTVYLPASGLLARIFAGRVTLPRARLTRPNRLGREVSLWIATPNPQHLTLLFPTDEDAAAFATALAPAVHP
ncbi:MAG TPA: hypothetical protein PK794_10020 [Armatimonadota bacterium]|nr:hypothetical protein [Armatimonadota bacterium]